ncbi:MAG: leucyl aminopeptidase [Alphaproteobacteria bacterium]|nr:leucyl aminopeptidase [Alphaproteobacteria bacterium]
MKITFAEAKPSGKGLLAVFVSAGRKLGTTAAALDRRTKGALARAAAGGSFSGKHGETVAVVAPAGLEAATVLLVGIGEAKALDALKLEALGARICLAANAQRAAAVEVMVDELLGAKTPAAEAAAEIAFGLRLRSYRFDKYLTRETADKKPTLAAATFRVAGAATARRAWAPLAAIADGVDFTRDIVSEPANVIYPGSLADACRKLAKLGVKVEVLGEKRMRELGMGAILGVAQGSVREPKLVVMRWNGGRASDKPLALVGKGVTFDTGGISIKPAAGMEDMKWDMAGAGAVIGAMHALAGRKARANIVGVVGLVENMPDGNAQRPGDIVRSMSGQTIEVLNTDAEGRLVLADAIWYTQDRFKPTAIVDLATLTGAILVALGREMAGFYATDDALAGQLDAAAKAVGEPLWRMPLGEAYDRQIDSPAADMKNIGGGRWGGSITGAQFIKRFTNDVKWAHLDIAGVVWAEKDKPLMEKGATAYGVRLLDRFVADNYER